MRYISHFPWIWTLQLFRRGESTICTQDYQCQIFRRYSVIFLQIKFSGTESMTYLEPYPFFRHRQHFWASNQHHAMPRNLLVAIDLRFTASYGDSATEANNTLRMAAAPRTYRR
jgi:hypothetical protein